MSNNKLAYWESKGHLAASFSRPDYFVSLWNKLKKSRLVEDDDEGGTLLQETRVSSSALGWTTITPRELCNFLQEEHRMRSFFLTSTSFSMRSRQRLQLLDIVYTDISRYMQTTLSNVGDEEDGGLSASLDRVRQGASAEGNRLDDITPEQRFTHFATRSAITIMFSFLKQLGRTTNLDLVQSLLDDATSLLSELPLACLKQMFCRSPACAVPSNWTFAFQQTMTFLGDVSKTTSVFPVHTRQTALILRVYLAATTGSLSMMLEAVSHMLLSSDLNAAVLLDLIQRFAEMKVIAKSTDGGHALDESFSHTMSGPEDYLASRGPCSDPEIFYQKNEIPAILLSHLARLSPPVRCDYDDVQVYGWGEAPNHELGFQRGRTLATPSLCSSLSQLKPLQITLGMRATFIIDSEGKLWSCGDPSSRILGHEGFGIKLVAGLENERFVQVAAIDHVLALTTRGEVYSWGGNSYSQLGRGDEPMVPSKITRGFGRDHIIYVAVGSQHSAAVSESGVLYTWGRGSYGRLGHGTSDDSAWPQPVNVFLSKRVKIVSVACGLGDAHTLALSADGTVYAFGDGDYGKLGIGSTDRSRTPVAITSRFDGTKVKQVWCGRQISACLTEGGALYTWGKFHETMGNILRGTSATTLDNLSLSLRDAYFLAIRFELIKLLFFSASGGALGNGESNGIIDRPARILTEHVVKSAYVGFQRGLALTQDGEVYTWGVLGSPASISIPHLLQDLSGKNITHVTGGPNHIVAWSGDAKNVSHSMSPFTPTSDPSLLEKFALLMEQFQHFDLTNDVHAKAVVISTLSLLERTFQVLSPDIMKTNEEALQSRLRQPLLDFAVGSYQCATEVRTAAQFCVLQGWELLSVPDQDRHCILEYVTSVVFRSKSPEPTTEEETAARQMLKTRWQCLMPMKERLHWLFRLLPQALSLLDAEADANKSEKAGTTSSEHSGHRFMLSVIVNSLFQQGVVETSVNHLFHCSSTLQPTFMLRVLPLLKDPHAIISINDTDCDSSQSNDLNTEGLTNRTIHALESDQKGMPMELQHLLVLVHIFRTIMKTRSDNLINRIHNNLPVTTTPDDMLKLCLRFIRSYFAQLLHGISASGHSHQTNVDTAEKEQRETIRPDTTESDADHSRQSLDILVDRSENSKEDVAYDQTKESTAVFLSSDEDEDDEDDDNITDENANCNLPKGLDCNNQLEQTTKKGNIQYPETHVLGIHILVYCFELVRQVAEEHLASQATPGRALELFSTVPCVLLAELLTVINVAANKKHALAGCFIEYGLSAACRLLKTLNNLVDTVPTFSTAVQNQFSFETVPSDVEMFEDVSAHTLLDVAQQLALSITSCLSTRCITAVTSLTMQAEGIEAGVLENVAFHAGLASRSSKLLRTWLPIIHNMLSGNADDAHKNMVSILHKYSLKNKLGLNLPQTHLMWHISSASLIVLCRHLRLTEYLNALDSEERIEAIPLLSEAVKVCVLIQPHVLRLKQELGISDETLKTRTQRICLFLLTSVVPSSATLSDSAPNLDGGWQQSRARVSVSEAPPIDPDALSTRVELDTSSPFVDFDEQGRQAVEDLQNDLQGHDRASLVQNAPSHPWFMPNTPQNSCLRAAPKEIAELIVSFLRQPFSLKRLKQQLHTRSVIAQNRIDFLCKLCMIIELEVIAPIKYQLLCGLLDSRSNPHALVPIGKYLERISCCSAAEKRTLMDFHNRFIQQLLDMLKVACDSLLRDIHETSEASTLPLRMLHLCQNILIQPHETETLEQILTSDSFRTLAQVCFRSPPATNSRQLLLAGHAPEMRHATDVGEDTVVNINSGLAFFDGIQNIKVSSNPNQARSLLEPSGSTFWESNGRRGAHWVMIQTRPGTVVHRLSITPVSADSFAPRQIVVRAGSDPANLPEIHRINCSQALSPSEDIILLDRARQHYPYIRLDVSSWGVNVRLRRVTLQSLDLAALRAHIAGKPQSRRVGRRLFKYIALAASCVVDNLSDRALDSLVSHCRLALTHGSDNNRASMLAVFRLMVFNSRLQMRFCDAQWLDMLLDLFRDATITVRIFVLRFLAAVLPGLAQAGSKSVNVRMLIQQLLRSVADFTDMPNNAENEAVSVELIETLRTLHTLPGWQTALNEVIVHDLHALPFQRVRLQEGSYNREDVRGVLGTLALIGLEAPNFYIGATCEHALRGTGTITHLSKTELTVELHALSEADSPLILSMADAKKELSIETLKPFDFMAVCASGHDQLAFRTLLFEAFSSAWPDHILSQKMQFEMLQACKQFFRTPVAFDLFIDSRAIGDTFNYHDLSGNRAKRGTYKVHQGQHSRQIQDSADHLDSRDTLIYLDDLESPRPLQHRSYENEDDTMTPPTATMSTQVAAAPASSSLFNNSNHLKTEVNANFEQKSTTSSAQVSRAQPFHSTMGRTNPDSEASSDSEDDETNASNQNTVDTVVIQGDGKPIVKFIETLLNWSVVPSPVRAEYTLESVSEACSEVIQSFLSNTSLSPPSSSGNLLIGEGVDRIVVASNSSMAKNLLDKSPETYWHCASNDQIAQIRIYMKPNQFIRTLRMYHDPTEPNHIPKIVKVEYGMDTTNLEAGPVVDVSRDSTSTVILENVSTYLHLIQLTIDKTFGGKEARIVYLEVLSSGTRHVDSRVSLEDFLAPSPEVTLHVQDSFSEVQTDLNHVATKQWVNHRRHDSREVEELLETLMEHNEPRNHNDSSEEDEIDNTMRHRPSNAKSLNAPKWHVSSGIPSTSEIRGIRGFSHGTKDSVRFRTDRQSSSCVDTSENFITDSQASGGLSRTSSTSHISELIMTDAPELSIQSNNASSPPSPPIQPQSPFLRHVDSKSLDVVSSAHAIRQRSTLRLGDSDHGRTPPDRFLFGKFPSNPSVNSASAIATASNTRTRNAPNDDVADNMQKLKSSIYFWGCNKSGMFDHFIPEARGSDHLPTPHRCTLLPNDLNVKDVCIQKEGVVLLGHDGRVFSNFQLNELKCINLNGPKIIAIAYGGYHILAVSENHTVMACGTGKNGKLGFRDTRDRSELERIPSLRDIVFVACGRRHSAAVSKSGRLFVWGCNHHGRLGLGNELDVLEPTPVGNLPPIKMIACGDRHSLAVTHTGRVYAWGCGDHGRLGIQQPMLKILQPHLIEDLATVNVTKVVCGCNTSAALTDQGKLYIWGAGRSYRLGNGSTLTLWRPSVVTDLCFTELVDVGLGHEHGIAVTKQGIVFAWGSNDSSQLGGCFTGAVAPTPQILHALQGTGLNRVTCGSRNVVAWNDDSFGTIDSRLTFDSTLKPVNVEEDRLGEKCLEAYNDVAVERMMEFGEKLPPLTSVIFHLPDRESQQKSVSYFLKAVRVYEARHLVTLWLSRGVNALDGVPWSPDRLLLVLVDLMRLSSMRSSAEEQHRVIASAIHGLCSRHNHLARSLVETCSLETQRFLPINNSLNERMMTDEFILTRVCSLGLIRTSIECTIAYLSGLSMLRLAHALASLWIQHHDTSVKQWVLVRFNTLLHYGSPDFLDELRRLVHFRDVGSSSQQQEDGGAADLKRRMSHQPTQQVAGNESALLQPSNQAVHMSNNDSSQVRFHSDTTYVSHPSLGSRNFRDEGEEEEDGELQSEILNSRHRDSHSSVGIAISSQSRSDNLPSAPLQSEERTNGFSGVHSLAEPCRHDELGRFEQEQHLINSSEQGRFERDLMQQTESNFYSPRIQRSFTSQDSFVDLEQQRRQEEYTHPSNLRGAVSTDSLSHVSPRSIVSIDEFSSLNFNGSGILNLCELALLLMRRGITCCYFKLAHTFAQLNIAFSQRLDYNATEKLLRKAGFTQTLPIKSYEDNRCDPLTQAEMETTLHEFAISLWPLLEIQHNHENSLEKDGRILLRSDLNRLMCRVAAGLDLPPGTQEKPSWFQVYCTTSREFNALCERQPFSLDFSNRIQSALEGRGSADETSEERACLDYLSNEIFTVPMDKAILHWCARAPDELRLSYTHDCVPTINYPVLKFQAVTTEHVRLNHNKTSINIQPEAPEENMWLLSDTLLTSGMHYWTVRCDSKGSMRRYVGVGVGKCDAAYPLGAARLLSDGILKSGTSVINIPLGFGPSDLVGVLLDLNRSTIAFDVNGKKRGEIDLPGLAPGEGVYPLVYMFYPGDKMSFVHGIPLPACYGLRSDPRSYFQVMTPGGLHMFAAPSLDSAKVGMLPPMHNGVATIVLATGNHSNREGVWISIANPDRMWGDGQCWCILRGAAGDENFRQMLTKSGEEVHAINDMNPEILMMQAATQEHSEKRSAECITSGVAHNIRAGPSLDAMVIGSIERSMLVYYADIVSKDGCEWLVLNSDTKERVVDPNMKHLDAFTLFKDSEGISYFRLEEAPVEIKQAPAAYPVLQDIPIGQIKRRCFLLETLSSAVLSNVSLIDFRPMEVSNGLALSLGGTQKALLGMQNFLSLNHKERLIKAIISRTMAAPGLRANITLNRVQIPRLPSGVAGIYGRNSVFAQAWRELRNVDPNVFLLAQRCWKVRFVGEGVDDAGGGYSESISEMCEELINGSLTLLIPTPNQVQDSGDSRDVYLLNPAATSPTELELFEFLGILIGISIRTNRGLALTIADLREVDTDYVTTLEILKSLSEEAFSNYGITGETPSANEALTYQVLEVPRLTPTIRDEYVRKALHLRLHEFDSQVTAVRKGMARVVPLPLVSMLQPSELQEYVLGKQDIDLALLKSMTRYKGMKSESLLARWFWDAMNVLSPAELSLFLRFVSGRTRLPRTKADFNGKYFILQTLDRYEEASSEADSALPEALTCFFTLKIPKYSSYEVLLEKLRYAINNCKAIDTDNYARTTLPS